MFVNRTPGRIIKGSKEAYQMMGAMCVKQSQSKEQKKEEKKIFSSHSQVLYLAAAIGLRNGKKLESADKKGELVKLDYLMLNDNWNAFMTLIKAKFDLTNEEEILDLFIQYFESGIRELYREYRKTGQIDFVRLSKT